MGEINKLFQKWQEKVVENPLQAIEDFTTTLSEEQHVALYEIIEANMEEALFDYLGNTF